MRRCVRMTTNGSGHGGSKQGGGSSASGSKGAPGPDAEPPKESDSSEKALFWAAVSGMTALTGRAGSDDDATTHGQSHKDSSSTSPRSSAHSEFGGEGNMDAAYLRGGGGGGYDFRTSMRELGGGSPLPSDPQCRGTNGADSFCNKLASVLVRALLPLTTWTTRVCLPVLAKRDHLTPTPPPIAGSGQTLGHPAHCFAGAAAGGRRRSPSNRWQRAHHRRLARPRAGH